MVNQARVFRLDEDEPTRVNQDQRLVREPRRRLSVRLVVVCQENLPVAQFACAVATTAAALLYVLTVVVR
jgi:hypothetical protein